MLSIERVDHSHALIAGPLRLPTAIVKRTLLQLSSQQILARLGATFFPLSGCRGDAYAEPHASASRLACSHATNSPVLLLPLSSRPQSTYLYPKPPRGERSDTPQGATLPMSVRSVTAYMNSFLRERSHGPFPLERARGASLSCAAHERIQ